MADRIERTTPRGDLPEFLTPDEFRAYVGIGRSTMYDLLRREEIPYVKFGRCIRIPKTALAAPGEPYRLCRRAHSLRGWTHGTTEQVFS